LTVKKKSDLQRTARAEAHIAEASKVNVNAADAVDTDSDLHVHLPSVAAQRLIKGLRGEQLRRSVRLGGTSRDLGKYEQILRRLNGAGLRE
jgi:hypothetical protein